MPPPFFFGERKYRKSYEFYKVKSIINAFHIVETFSTVHLNGNEKEKKTKIHRRVFSCLRAYYQHAQLKHSIRLYFFLNGGWWLCLRVYICLCVTVCVCAWANFKTTNEFEFH